jgi:hypothetical protein
MTRLSAEIELAWGPGTFTFAVKGKQAEELEHVCKMAFGRICFNVFTGVDYSYVMLRETIRLGLIGGGTPPVEAKKLVDFYVDGQPVDPTGDPSSTLKTATAILKAAHFGWEDLPEAPQGEPEKKATGAPSGASTGPHS